MIRDPKTVGMRLNRALQNFSLYILFTFSHYIPYNSENKPWGLYFSKALSEGLIFGGAYLRR